jgi:DNA-binding IclR family transcriptional regulator
MEPKPSPAGGAPRLAAVLDVVPDTTSSNARGNCDEHGQRRTLMTAVHVMLVLEAVATDPRGVTAKSIARKLGHSLSSTYYALQSLTSLGFIEPSPASHGLYTLGPKIADLFEGYVASWTLPHRLEPTLAELRDAAGARAYSAVWSKSDLEVTLVRGRRGATELQDVSAGFRGAAHALAVGKILLAATHPLRWPAYLRGLEFTRYTDNTIGGHSGLQEELVEARRTGLAYDIEEYAENVCCIAAPVRDTAGRVFASIGVSVTARRFHKDRHKLEASVKAAAASASRMYEPLDPLGRLMTEAASR